MIIRNTLKAAALASVCLIPLAAAAQDDNGLGFAMPEAAPNTQALTTISNQPAEVYDNEATLGLRGQTSQSAVFGRYNGQYSQGVDLVGSLKMKTHQDWKSSDTYYMYFNAKDLSFGAGDHFDLAPDSEVNLKVGNQGTWGLTADYWANTYVASDSFKTIYNQNGTLVPGVPGNTGNTATGTASKDAPFAQTDVIGLRRDRGALGLNYIFGDWTFTGKETHEHKEGTMEKSGLETGGSNGGYATFPLPINYDTDRFDMKGAYNTIRSQTELYYTFLNFQDNNSAFNYSPYETKANGLGAVNYGPTGYYAQAPSNMAHTFGVNSGYNLSDVTRLNANLQYGLQMQNDGFVPATGVALSASDQSKLASNPTSLDGLISTVFGNLAMTTVPFSKATLRASYTLDGRYSDTGGRWIYGDAGDKSTTSAAGALTDRYATEPSWTKQTASLEVGYRVLPSTRVSLGYDYRQTDRTEAITANTKENDITAKARTTFSPNLVGSLQYTYSDTSASSANWTFWNTFISSDCYTHGGCLEIPYYEAAKVENSIQGRLTDSIGSNAAASLFAKYDVSNYGSSYGVKQENKISAGPDLNYRFSHDVNVNLFYTFMRTQRAMTDGGYSNGQTTLPFYQNNETTTGNTHSAGINSTWKASNDLKFGADYNFSYGTEAFSQSGAWMNVASEMLPAVTSMDNSVKIHAEYEYIPGMSFYLGYGFDRLTMSDWALWGSGADAAGQPQLSTGEGNPNYTVNTILTKVIFKW